MTIPIRAAIITVSDRSARGEREDQSGPCLKGLLEDLQAEVIAYRIVPDDRDLLRKVLCHIADKFACDVILTNGGTGMALRDVTPEATRDVIEREAPGLAEALRFEGWKKNPHAVLSRGVAGIRGRTLIVNLPGNPEAVREALEVLAPILPHAVLLLRGEVSDCKQALSSSSYSHR